MVSVTRKDYFLVAVIGFLFGLLLLPVLANLKLSFFNFNFGSVIAIVVACAIAAVVALWIIADPRITSKIPVLLQIAKFSAVGGLNTLLDLGVLNVLIFLAGSSTAHGLWYSIFKAISFIVANTNSYFWNKYWTFGSTPSVNVREFSQFLTVSIVGFGINVAVASSIVNAVAPLGGISPERWANVGALMATIVALVWNFLGYKFIVFKRT